MYVFVYVCLDGRVYHAHACTKNDIAHDERRLSNRIESNRIESTRPPGWCVLTRVDRPLPPAHTQVAVVLHKHISTCEARLLRLRTRQQQHQALARSSSSSSFHHQQGGAKPFPSSSSLRPPPLNNNKTSSVASEPPAARREGSGGRGSPTDDEEEEEEDDDDEAAALLEEGDGDFDLVKMRLFNEEGGWGRSGLARV